VLASGGADNKIILWNVVTGRLLRRMEAGPIHNASEVAPRLTSLAFSPDGRLIASAGNNYRVTIWNAATGREIRSLQANLSGGTSSVNKVAFSPDGKVIAAIYESSDLVLWNMTSGKQLLSVEASGVTSLAFSPNGKEIVTGNGDGTIKLWDAATGKEVRSFAGHSDWLGSLDSGPDVFSLAFSPEGKTFVSASRDGTLKLWDTASGNLLRTFTGHTSEVRSVTFSTNGKLIVSGSLDGTMKLWSPNSDEPLVTLITLDQTDWVVITPDNHFDASPGAEKLLHFVTTSPDGQYKIIPFLELKSRHYEAGLLPRLLKRGV
jgi:WD40 repeat protein